MCEMAKLYIGKNAAKNVSKIEQDIKQYIDFNPPEEYDDVLRLDNRWEVFYNLTAMRRSVLNWYDFNENADLLEIGGETGALTSLFCEKCRRVTVLEKSEFKARIIQSRCREKKNLRIYAGELEDIPEEQMYDYITIIGELEIVGGGENNQTPYVEFLQKIIKRLKPNGRVLIAVENRYGLRYFCGTAEPHTGIPYSGINNYPYGTPGYSFDKKEISDIIKNAGYKDIKFYYPLPDYKLTQLVYSDEYLPEKNLKERILFYHLEAEKLLALENQIYGAIIENQVFPFFSNSFLIDCGMSKMEAQAIYATLTTDRGKEDALATVIYNSGYVHKRALYKEGETRTQLVYHNMMDLKKRGIHIVPHRKEGNNLIMPYVYDIMLSDYLRQIVYTEPDMFEECIDRLYQEILKSSDSVPAEKNQFPVKVSGTVDFGTILKRAYIDMIPLNCFYINGEMVFFDQEFVRENYPALYTLFRALKYIYLFDPGIDNKVPLEKLKEKYHMKDIWDLFIEEENRFVAENRKYDVYKHFYKWVWVDENRIFNNGEKCLIYL